MRAESLQLRKGQKLSVRISDVLSLHAVIVEFQGQLFRVTNETGDHLMKGQFLTLEVTSESPLLFRIQSRDRSRSFDRFG